MERPSPTEMQLLFAWIANMQTSDAWDEVNELVDSKPELAWRVIEEMVRLAPTEHALSAVAAGPLQDLLHRHPRFVRSAAASARADLKWQKCLEGVWGLEGSAGKLVERALAARTPVEVPVTGSISRRRSGLIARWFHHSETMWASAQMDDTVRRDPDKGWDLMMLLIRLASEPRNDEVLAAIHTFVFASLIEKHTPVLTEKVVVESERNVVIRTWVEERRRYRQIGPEWLEILRRTETAG